MVAFYKQRGSCGDRDIVPVEGDSRYLRSASEQDGILDIARQGGDRRVCFGKFCQEHLCSESWNFILSAVSYYDQMLNPGEFVDGKE